MLSKKLQEAINEQIKHEFYSAYLYLAMAAHCESVNLPGFAKWLKVQSHEEWTHGMKFYDFLVDRGARVVLLGIPQPPAAYKGMLEMFEEVLAHEKKVTALINRLYELALQEKDYPAQVMLQWFINEQVEEEKSASLVVEQLKMVSEKGGALLYLDRHMAKRGEKD
ncbi:MAG: ferritin [Planctomycetota bacterium]|nr:ferritin [Planctomycetota bacterium]